MASTYVWHAIFGLQAIGHHGWTIHSQVIWIALLVFSAVAAWFDVRVRRIPNLWNLCGVCAFLALQAECGAGISAGISMFITGALLLIPTLCGIWGQGDWKMAMVYGAALGVLPTLVVWWLAMLLAKGSSVLVRKLDIKRVNNSAKLGLPLAAFVLVATIMVYAGMYLLR